MENVFYCLIATQAAAAFIKLLVGEISADFIYFNAIFSFEWPRSAF